MGRNIPQKMHTPLASSLCLPVVYRLHPHNMEPVPWSSGFRWDQLVQHSAPTQEEGELLDQLLQLLETYSFPRDLARLILSYRSDQDRLTCHLSTKGTKLVIPLGHPFHICICSRIGHPHESLRLCDSTLSTALYLVLQRHAEGIWTTPTYAIYHRCASCQKLTKKVCSRCRASAFCSTQCLKRLRHLHSPMVGDGTTRGNSSSTCFRSVPPGHCSSTCFPPDPTQVQFRLPIGYGFFHWLECAREVRKEPELPPGQYFHKHNCPPFPPRRELELPLVPDVRPQSLPPISHQPLFAPCLRGSILWLYLLTSMEQYGLSDPAPLVWNLLGGIRMQDVKIVRDASVVIPKLVWVASEIEPWASVRSEM
jgi:hypothetical protein